MGKFIFFYRGLWIIGSRLDFLLGPTIHIDPPEKCVWICGRSIRCRLVESTRTWSCFMKIGKVVEGARWFHDLLWILNLVLCHKSCCKCNFICIYTYWICVCVQKRYCVHTRYTKVCFRLHGGDTRKYWWEPPNILGPHEVPQTCPRFHLDGFVFLVFFGPQDFWHLHRKRIV